MKNQNSEVWTSTHLQVGRLVSRIVLVYTQQDCGDGPTCSSAEQESSNLEIIPWFFALFPFARTRAGVPIEPDWLMSLLVWFR